MEASELSRFLDSFLAARWGRQVMERPRADRTTRPWGDGPAPENLRDLTWGGVSRQRSAARGGNTGRRASPRGAVVCAGMLVAHTSNRVAPLAVRQRRGVAACGGAIAP